MTANKSIEIACAVFPILSLIVSIGIWKIPTHIAGLVGFFMTAAFSVFIFTMDLPALYQASVEGFMLALHPILWVIVSALFIYNITVSTGSMESIKAMLSAISPDRRIQALILAFGLGSFLEAVAGFGTAVAIPASIMVALGFNAFSAATICLVANTIPVAFGVLGVPIITLSQITSLSLKALSINTALQLLPFIILLPFAMIYILTGKFRSIKGMLGVSIASGIAFAIGQTLTTLFIGPELAAVIGSLLTIVTIILWIRVFPIKNIWRFDTDPPPDTSRKEMKSAHALRAWSPYLLLLILVFSTKFIPIFDFLNAFPFRLEKQFYFGSGGKPMVFQLGTGAGTLLFLSAIGGGLIQGAGAAKLIGILGKTIFQVRKTIITVISIVMLSKIMTYSGMIREIGSIFAYLSGRFYPIIAPIIGAIGTFITGSDTSSNVLFGELQKQTANQLGMNQEWITAANASGATAGKMISPQSISIATNSVGIHGKEGEIFKFTLKYCVTYVVLLGILVFIFK